MKRKMQLDEAFANQMRLATMMAMEFQVQWEGLRKFGGECAVARENMFRLLKAYAKVAMQHKRFIRFMLTETRKPNKLLYNLHKQHCPGCRYADECLNEYEKKFCGIKAAK